MSDKCVKDYTVVYSQPSIEAFENLMNTIIRTFGLVPTLDEMFYYNVFCKDITYANYDWSEDESELNVMEAPDILTNGYASPIERLDYVRKLMKQITKGEVEKPTWMIHIEMNAEANEYGFQPSTFLYLIPKKEEFKELGEKIIKFLYSPNLLITMIET